MSYAHMFYGVDVGRLRNLAGSHDETFLADFLADPPEDFEHASCCDLTAEDALRRIVSGESAGDGVEHAATYGYVLKAVCERLTGGELLNGEVACVRDLPLDLLLPGSGPPVPIPVDSDFPEIGFLTAEQVPEELERLSAKPGRPKKPPLRARFALWLLQKRLGVRLNSLRTPSPGELEEEIAEYRSALEEARSKGLGVVSFRH